MNNAAIQKHLERFIADNERIEFGVSAIQRDCRVSYNQGCRVMELGIKQGLFEQDERKPYRVKVVRDATENAPN
jgi:hypothetical protein